MTEDFWQLQLVKRSLKKKEKLRLLDKHLRINNSDRLLDLGCAQGILSYFLRKKGGFWISADLDLVNVQTSREILKDNIIQTGTKELPFKNSSLDHVVSLDYLEHLEDDDHCLTEIVRILKPGGSLVLAVPRTGKIFLLHKIRPALGMTLDFYGHKREGYSLKAIKKKLQAAGLVFQKHRSFSKFFSELIELLLNSLYIKFFKPSDLSPNSQRDGHIRPTTKAEFDSKKKAFKAYSFIYPFVWLITRLDFLLFFQRGYGLIVWAQKPGNTDS